MSPLIRVKTLTAFVFDFKIKTHTDHSSLMLANIPQNATFGETTDTGFIEPNKALALTTSFLLGLGDSCYNTQVK